MQHALARCKGDTMRTRVRIDLFKRFRNEYVAPKSPRMVQITPALYLAVRADNDSNGAETDARERALFAVALELRAAIAAKQGREFVLGKLEWQLGSNCAEDDVRPCMLMLRVPDFASAANLDTAIDAALTHQTDSAVAYWIRHVQLQQLNEGWCAQMLQSGRQTAEGQAETVHELQKYVKAQGHETGGLPHVVSLATARHVPPEHMRTLIRIPVRTTVPVDQFKPAQSFSSIALKQSDAAMES
jgi:hypothetical protein